MRGLREISAPSLISGDGGSQRKKDHEKIVFLTFMKSQNNHKIVTKKCCVCGSLIRRKLKNIIQKTSNFILFIMPPKAGGKQRNLEMKRAMAKDFLAGMTKSAAAQKYKTSKGTVGRVRKTYCETRQQEVPSYRFQIRPSSDKIMGVIGKGQEKNCIITGALSKGLQLLTVSMDGHIGKMAVIDKALRPRGFSRINGDLTKVPPSISWYANDKSWMSSEDL